LTEGGVLYRTQIVCSCFYCRRRTLTGRLKVGKSGPELGGTEYRSTG